MDAKKLLFEIINAVSEEDVNKIIKEDSVLSDDKNWRPLFGSKSNTGTAHSQQDNAIAALVEKPINSIDAILIKECKKAGIDPESKEAPDSIVEAVEKFFKIKKGDYSELYTDHLRSLAEQIQIIAEGDKRSPNIIIYDYGEGQGPEDFEKTFLYKSSENKIKIKFVQGKFNMGGTGVLPFCGTKKYQLILSRKDPALLKSSSNPYGFTLVRFHEVHTLNEFKSQWYEYCVGADGKILSFEDGELDLGLFNRKFSSGTYIKLFDYQLPNKSDITLDLWRDLNRYMYYPALPLLVFEKRDYKGKNPDKMMLGNKMRINKNHREQREIPTFELKVSAQGNEFTGEVTVFKEDVDKTEFINDMAVVFTQNGQVHDDLPNSFIGSKRRVGLPYLEGSVLVNIDCSNISPFVRDQLFMSSRDRRRQNDLTKELDDEIASELKDLDVLTKLNEKRRAEKVFNNPKDEDFLNKVMGRLVEKNDELSKLLGLNGKVLGKVSKDVVKAKPKQQDGAKKASVELKRFPSFIRFSNVKPGEIKMMPKNGELKLEIETDVEDEYLSRTVDTGSLKVIFKKVHKRSGEGPVQPGETNEILPLQYNRVGPLQGELKLRIKPSEMLSVGDEIEVDIELSSPDGPHELVAMVKIVEPASKAGAKSKDDRQTHELPILQEVYEKIKEGITVATWDQMNPCWGGDDICKIWPSSEQGKLVDQVSINMDAFALHDYVRKKKLNGKQIEGAQRLFKISIYLIALILYFQLNNKEAELEKNDSQNRGISKEEQISYLMKGIGKIILNLVINEEIMSDIEK